MTATQGCAFVGYSNLCKFLQIYANCSLYMQTCKNVFLVLSASLHLFYRYTDIMRKCWEMKTKDRPSFAALVPVMQTALEKQILVGG